MDVCFEDPLFVQCIGKSIIRVDLCNNVLNIRFLDGCGLAFKGETENGADYMTCDDDLNSLVGSKLVSGMIQYVYFDTSEHIDLSYFLRIQGTDGCITLKNYIDRTRESSSIEVSILEIDKMSAHQVAALLAHSKDD